MLIREGRLLLVEHTREEEAYWVLPGGHVEPGEDLEEAVRRELREELTLEVTPGRLLWVHQFIHPNRHTINFSFQVECVDLETLKLNPGPRLSGWRWFTSEQLRGIDLRPPISEPCAAMCRGQAPGHIGVYRF